MRIAGRCFVGHLPVRPANTTAGMVRAEAPARILEVVAALGGSPRRVLDATGIVAAELADTDRPIEVETHLQLIDAAARESGDDCFGLHAGALIELEWFGLLTYAVFNAPTVGTALRNLERYARLHFRGPRIVLTSDGNEAQFGLELDVPEGIPSRHHDEGAAVIAMRIVRRLVGPDWRPRRVLFAHDAPRDLSELRRVFGAPLRFGQPVRFRLVFDAADLEHPVLQADRSLLPVIERHLDELLVRPSWDRGWLDDVRTTIASSLCDGRPKIGTIARQLGTSVRTFQRRLGEHAVTFKGLVEDVRRELSLRYVANDAVGLTEVAFLVGYSDLSAFGRAFRRWTGSTPLAMRNDSSVRISEAAGRRSARQSRLPRRR